VRVQADRTCFVDVGTAAMNMLLMVQDLGLGACPVTSFSQRAVSVLLDLPDTLVPELMVLLGTPIPQERTVRPGASTRLTVEDLTFVATADRGLQRYGGVRATEPRS
jgi:nitroreductase